MRTIFISSSFFLLASFIRLSDYLIVNTMHVLAVNSVSTLLNYLSEQLQNTPPLAEIQSYNETKEEEEELEKEKEKEEEKKEKDEKVTKHRIESYFFLCLKISQRGRRRAFDIWDFFYFSESLINSLLKNIIFVV